MAPQGLSRSFGTARSVAFDVASKVTHEPLDMGQTSDMGNINTYDSSSEADADRAQQKALLAALGAWDHAMRRDECGAWTITGKQGSIHTWGDGKTWVLYVACRSGQHWTITKGRLGFCEVSQDGDDEGCLRLRQLPTPEQASVIRDVLGIRERQEISEATRERLRAFAFDRKPRSEASVEPNIGLGGPSPTDARVSHQPPILDARLRAGPG